MIYFSFREIMLSVLYSLIYGGIFGLFLSFLSVFSESLRLLFERIYKGVTISFKSAIALEKKERIKISFGRLSVFILIILFTVGYILLSYLSLDGQIRLYTLLLSLVSLFVTQKIMSLSVQRVIFFIFDKFTKLISICICALLILPKKIFLSFFRMLSKRNGKTNLNKG